MPLESTTRLVNVPAIGADVGAEVGPSINPK